MAELFQYIKNMKDDEFSSTTQWREIPKIRFSSIFLHVVTRQEIKLYLPP